MMKFIISLILLIIATLSCGMDQRKVIGITEEEAECIYKNFETEILDYTTGSFKERANQQFEKISENQSIQAFRSLCNTTIASIEEVSKTIDQVSICFSNEKKNNMIMLLNVTMAFTQNFCNINEDQLKTIFNKDNVLELAMFALSNTTRMCLSRTTLNSIDNFCEMLENNFNGCFETLPLIHHGPRALFEVIVNILQTTIDCSNNNSVTLNYLRKLENNTSPLIEL